MKSIILFPGQGAQYLGMAKKFLIKAQDTEKIKRIFQVASNVFKRDLLELCMSGPKEELDKTVNCQAAIFCTSLAHIEMLKEKDKNIIRNCIGTAGFSVGEYAALVFAGALTFENALTVLKLRSKLMQDASNAVPSGLITVNVRSDSKTSLLIQAAKEWCEKKLELTGPVECAVANYLTTGYKVIGGNEEAINFIELNYSQFNILRVKRLPVSGAFHTKLMEPIGTNPLKELLEKTEIERPKIPAYSNITGKPYQNEGEIVQLLSEQYYKPCKWEQIIHNLYATHYFNKNDEVLETYETGPGRQLGAFLKSANGKAYKYYVSLDSIK